MFSPLSHLRPPLPRSLYNMWPLQARWERGVSAQAKWVRENEAGMSPSPQKKDDPQSEKTHPRESLSHGRARTNLHCRAWHLRTIGGLWLVLQKENGPSRAKDVKCSVKNQSQIKNSSIYISLAGLEAKDLNARAESVFILYYFFAVSSFQRIILICFVFLLHFDTCEDSSCTHQGCCFTALICGTNESEFTDQQRQSLKPLVIWAEAVQ